MKIGLYGGTFDPIHYGHIRPVLEAQRQLDLDQVIFLPTGRPPHKPDRSLAPSHARLAMVELALLPFETLLVSPFELGGDAPSYAIDSAEHVAASNPGADLHLLMGGDSFLELESWRRWEDLSALCRIAVLVRPGWDVSRIRAESTSALAELVERERVAFIRNPPEAISSTALRELFARGEEPPPGTVPPLVVQYVMKYLLY